MTFLIKLKIIHFLLFEITLTLYKFACITYYGGFYGEDGTIHKEH